MAPFFIFSAAGILLFACAVLDHRGGNSGLFDLGIFDQVVYGASRGDGWYSSVLAKHIFGDHVSAILFLLVPLYHVWPFPETLLALQSLALAGGAWLCGLLARSYGGDSRHALLWGLLYLAHPTIFYINVWDFHPLTFAVPVLLGGALLEVRQKFMAAAFVYLSSVLVREELGLVLAGIGLGWIIFQRKRLAGVALAAAGLAAFFLCAGWIIPKYSGGVVAHLERYNHLGSDGLQIAKHLLLHPLSSLWSSTTGFKLLTMIVLFLPFGCLTLLSPSRLFYLVVPFSINYLSVVENQFNFRAHYMSTLIPFVAAGAIEGRKRLQSWLAAKQMPAGWIPMVLIILAVSFQCVHVFAPPISSRRDVRLPIAISRPASLVHVRTAMSWVPGEAHLVVSNALGPHVSQRAGLYLFGYERKLIKDERAFLLVDVHASDPWPMKTREDYLTRIEQWLHFRGRRVLFYRDGLVLAGPGGADKVDRGEILADIRSEMEKQRLSGTR